MNTDKRREKNRIYMQKRREEARKAGIELPSDCWAKKNPEKHRRKTERWRANNADKAKEISRRNQADRRSTPWGRITNRIRSVMNIGIKNKSSGQGKYNKVLGYTWLEAREHIESMFQDGMSWDNWGDLWEVDHIVPVSSFRYESIHSKEFVDCWKLENIRPLLKHENAKKGAKI